MRAPKLLGAVVALRFGRPLQPASNLESLVKSLRETTTAYCALVEDYCRHTSELPR